MKDIYLGIAVLKKMAPAMMPPVVRHRVSGKQTAHYRGRQ